MVEGVNSAESAELQEVKKRIKALEKELQLVKNDSELFDAQAVVTTKGVRQEPVD